MPHIAWAQAYVKANDAKLNQGHAGVGSICARHASAAGGLTGCLGGFIAGITYAGVILLD
jgi:hypothetical protein